MLVTSDFPTLITYPEYSQRGGNRDTKTPEMLQRSQTRSAFTDSTFTLSATRKVSKRTYLPVREL
jgi:hypothetical protein